MTSSISCYEGIWRIFPTLILEGSPTLSAPLHFGGAPTPTQHRWLQSPTRLAP